nr:MAG TPA: hypothetical protein [Caudoviricetes sp.]
MKKPRPPYGGIDRFFPLTRRHVRTVGKGLMSRPFPLPNMT